MYRCLISLCLTLPICAASLSAQPVPAGNDFQVNTLTTDYQREPDVAVATNGDFVVVWELRYDSGGGGRGVLDDPAVRGQRYASDGTALGGEFQINTYTTDAQVRPHVATSSNGGFVVVWDSYGSAGADTSGRSIQGQRFAPGGTALGAQFEINSYTTNSQGNAHVAIGPGDDFVVVWETSDASVGTDSDGDGISGRRFASDGTPIGGDFQVNTYTTGNQRLGGIGIGPGGEFLVVWDSFGSGGTDTSLWSVHGQRYASDGSPVGSELQVNTYTTSSQFGSDLAVAPNGEAVVVWESTSPVPPDTDSRSIQGQRYASDGSPLGSEFVVNSYTTSSQGRPNIAVDSTGEFTVAWQSSASAGDDNSYQSIQFRRLDSGGTPVGQDFQVNTYTTETQNTPAVSAQAGNAFVVVWESEGSSGDDSSLSSVQARRFVPPNPVLGVAKEAGPTVDNGNGTFTVTLSFVVENLGNVQTEGVQVTDDLTAAFPGLTFSVTPVTSPTLTVNPAFNGAADTALLAGTDVLAIGTTATISFSLTFDPGANPGPFLNSATTNGTSPAGTPVSDISDDGSDPDPNGNGDPTEPGENDPTPIAFTESPVLGVAKAAGATSDNGDGTFSVALSFVVENLGNVQIDGVQVTDDLAAAFPGLTFSVASLTSPTLSVNPAFDGDADTALLAGTDIVAVGATATISFSLTFDPGANPGPFLNSATASGNSPAGTPVSDVSDDGSDPDPNGNGDPTEPGENDPTPIAFTELPVLGVAKEAGATIDNGDGSSSLELTFVLENLGNVGLNELQLIDDLGATFPGATVTVNSLTSPTLTINPAFDGVLDTALLAGTDILATGATATVTSGLTIDPGTDPGPFFNSAVATATSPASANPTDISQDGSDPDPDGDGDPTNNDEPTMIELAEGPEVLEIPTLQGGWLLALVGLLAVAGLRFIRS